MTNNRDQVQSARREKETGRVEAFSDGVFAIAITLLILEIPVPRLGPGASGQDLRVALLALWPSFVAFLGSFSAILVMWINHHGLFKMIDCVNSRLFFANGFLLLLVTFMPFPTAILAEYLNRQGAHVAAVFYCGTFVLINVAFNLLWYTAARHRRLIKEEVPRKHVIKIRNAYLIAFPIYMGAMLFSIWSAVGGVALCLSLWILWTMLDYNHMPDAGSHRASGP
ncbi:MAG: TMEM175 family protein [Acidiferrobacter sp.]